MNDQTSRLGLGRALGAIALIAVLGASCSDSGPSACGPIVEEEVDTQSSLHVASGTDVEYLTWPPTSGPHLGGDTPSGLRTEPLPGPFQVRILEDGKVLIQYEGISSGDIDKLADLAGESVVVAPGTDLPSAVVTTAWTTKQTCSEVDTGTHADFVEIYAVPELAD